MLAVRKRKLKWLVFILFIVSSVLGLVLYALRQNISLFYTPSQITAGHAPLNHKIRMGGMVEKGSIHRAAKSLDVVFIVSDYKRAVQVSYTGVLPDLFREGQGVVAEGVLNDRHHFKASQVLAKHDENYMPPEVKAALDKKGSE